MADTLLADFLAGKMERGNGQSLQMQLYSGVRKAITGGALKPGARVPSSRSLAEALGIARVTVVNAYEKLLIDGYLQTGSSSGTYVADSLPAGDGHGLTAQAPATHVLSRRGEALLSAPAGIQERSGAFVPGVCDAEEFPYQTWRRIQQRYSGDHHYSLSGYANHGGYLPLRRALAEYLRISRGVRCSPDQVIVTMGTNQSLDLCARILTDHGDRAYVETPCHWVVPIVLRACGLELSPVPVDDAGMQVDRLLQPSRLVFVTPSHQFPMGVTLSQQRRDALLQYANRVNAYVVEDDYDGEFRYDQRTLNSLQGSDNTGRVIFLGTFSKIMYPGLRLSYMVVPAELESAFAGAALRLYRPGHLPLQAAMAEFIDNGHFARHIRNMRGIYSERRSELQRCLDLHFGDAVKTARSAAGLHMTIRIAGLPDVDRVVERAREEGIFLRQLSTFNQQGGRFEDGFVLGFGAVRHENIASSVETLAEIVADCIGNRGGCLV